MFLRRVSVTGFKSFASKTVLDLEPGITGVVGPNGSGKSNVADAVRWALGEQSKGRLRLEDREEVIFAGTAGHAKASYAEVVLVFNNEDGTFPLELTEVEISRRLYRSGETDYKLAGRAVRLSDIQTLLAQAGFGIGTYTIIGQGMIDSLLLSSPAERKLLFDEAAGIRGPELGREAALRKLTATQGNLTRLRDIAAELAPRLTSLQHTAVTTAELDRLENRVGELRAAVTAAGVARWIVAGNTAAARLAELKAELTQLERDAKSLGRQLAVVQEEAAAAARERDQLQESLAGLEHERDQLAARLTAERASLDAARLHHDQLSALSAAQAAAEAELATVGERRDELESELTSNAESERRALRAVEKSATEVAAAQAALVALRRSSADGTRDQYVDHALQILKTLAISLDDATTTHDEIRLLVHKAGRLLSHATRMGAVELLANVKTAQKQLETAMNKREIAVEHQTNITITGRSLEIDLTHQRESVTRAQQQLERAIAALTAAQGEAADLSARNAEVKRLETALAAAASQLDRKREQVRALSATSTTTQTQMELTGALEHARSGLAAAQATRDRNAADLAAAQTALAVIADQAHRWGLTPPKPPVFAAHLSHTNAPTPAGSTTAASASSPVLAASSPAESVESLSAQLVRAETLLETRLAARRDQATELEQVGERQAELERQITDLESAKADLETVITELDTLIRSRFKDNFHALAAQFSTYFGRLFAGGTASLELTEDEDGKYGITIKASPAGKRLTSITALSGGERAMAGVALLAAILRVNPSPFIVLDEIDAALDEANSGRLADILTELGQHSQLIVITHNRQTMKIASVLFGITLGQHHVSHILSMRLEEATALAAR